MIFWFYLVFFVACIHRREYLTSRLCKSRDDDCVLRIFSCNRSYLLHNFSFHCMYKKVYIKTQTKPIMWSCSSNHMWLLFDCCTWAVACIHRREYLNFESYVGVEMMIVCSVFFFFASQAPISLFFFASRYYKICHFY